MNNISKMIDEQQIILKYGNDNDGIILAIKNDESIETIKFIHDNYDISNQYNILFNIACQYNTNLDVIKYLAEELNLNTNILDEDGDNAFNLACYNNTNIEVIKYLAEELKLNTNMINDFGNNAFNLACMYNINLDVIQYLAEELNLNTEIISKDGNNAFNLACHNNTNIEVIKYLAEELKLNTEIIGKDGNNAFNLACYNNTNVEVIKYLAEELKLNTEIIGKDGDNAFNLACYNNTNVEVIKYLAEELKLNTEIIDKDGDNAFNLACYNNTNIDVMKYLLKLNSIVGMIFYKYDSIILEHLIKYDSPLQYLMMKNSIKKTVIKNEHKIKLIKYFIDNNLHEFISHNYVKLKNIDDLTYDMINYVINYINYEIKVDCDISDKLYDSFIEIIDMHNKTTITELTFTVDFIDDDDDKNYVNIPYYGSKLMIFTFINQFYVFSQNGIEKNNGIHLKISQPKHVFDAYIKMHYNGKINLTEWNIDDILHLIELMDMYPSILINIKNLEDHMVHIINISNDYSNVYYDILKELCDKNELSKLLITINNKYHTTIK
jgi:hypothetical protein